MENQIKENQEVEIDLGEIFMCCLAGLESSSFPGLY